MEVLGFVSAIVGMLAVLLSVWYLARWIIGKSERKPHFRKRFFLSGGVFILAIVGAGIFGGQQIEKEALEAGFVTSDEYLAAKRENVTDPEAWAAIVSEREAEAEVRAEAEATKARVAAEEARKAAEEEAARAAAETEAAEAERIAAEEAKAAMAEEQRLAEEAECKRELSCWGEKASTVAMFTCPRFVERMARYDYEWTDGFLDVKFSHYRWKDVENGIVTVIGDKIKFQNGFGAWSNMIYECDVNPATETVLDVRVSEGRI